MLDICGEGFWGPEADTCRGVAIFAGGTAVVDAGPIRLRKFAAADVLPPPKNGLLGFGADIGPDALLVMLVRLVMEVRPLLEAMWA